MSESLEFPTLVKDAMRHALQGAHLIGPEWWDAVDVLAPRVAAAIDRVATEYAQDAEHEVGSGAGQAGQRLLFDMRAAALRVLRGDAP